MPLPGGGYVLTTSKVVDGHRIRITSIVKDPPDLESLANAMIQLAEETSGGVDVLL